MHCCKTKQFTKMVIFVKPNSLQKCFYAKIIFRTLLELFARALPLCWWFDLDSVIFDAHCRETIGMVSIFLILLILIYLALADQYFMSMATSNNAANFYRIYDSIINRYFLLSTLKLWSSTGRDFVVYITYILILRIVCAALTLQRNS